MKNGYTVKENELIAQAMNENGYTADDVESFSSREWCEFLDYIHMTKDVRISL